MSAILDTFFTDAEYMELLEAVGLAGMGNAAWDVDDGAFAASPLEEAYRRLCGLAERSAWRDKKRVTGRRLSRRNARILVAVGTSSLLWLVW